MNSEFCMHCGSKVEFTLQVPNFCPSCGNAFNKEATAREVQPSAPEPETTSSSLPNISKLEYSIGGTAPKVTFGDLAAQAQNSQEPYVKAPPRPAPATAGSEDVLKRTMAECASAREPVDLGGQE